MAGIWAKVDALLPQHPKCDDGGFWATTVYFHLLLLNKAHGCQGLVPPSFAAPRYLSRHTRLHESPQAEDAEDLIRFGLKEAVRAKLIRLTQEGVHILGWDRIWDRGEDNSRDRTRAWRARQVQPPDPHEGAPESCDDGDTSQRHGDDGDVVTARSDQIRSDQIRVDPPIVPRGDGDGEEPEKPKAKTQAERLLAKWREQAEELWDLQELQRKTAIPGSKGLKATADRLVRICERLDGGASQEDCVAVIEAYAKEARRDPSKAKHLNGVTNWRPRNFDQTLGMIGASVRDVTVGQVEPRPHEDHPGGELEI